ncbi:hypothetical protein ATANTOWER_025013 [Ataeniobius toweri]|uniref:Uncharacterized protein n=1 Tax=Ataeniobius toweri TaxID=208326 RepID=A0ABU7C9D7_9TELE|nr:hypothetical protein [Ataeniobius toweri]
MDTLKIHIYLIQFEFSLFDASSQEMSQGALQNKVHSNQSCKQSSSSASSGTGSRGQQTLKRHPDIPLPRHLLQLLRGEPKAPAERHSPSSVSWTSSRWDLPGPPPEEGVLETSGIDA